MAWPGPAWFGRLFVAIRCHPRSFRVLGGMQHNALYALYAYTLYSPAPARGAVRNETHASVLRGAPRWVAACLGEEGSCREAGLPSGLALISLH